MLNHYVHHQVKRSL